MLPKHYLKKFAAAVSERTGISRATLEVAIPAVFDEIRYQLCEGKYPHCPIDSFGTFAVVDIPERERLYTYKGANEMRTYPPVKRLKFAPTQHMKKEIEQGKFDPSRTAFTHHPEDGLLRRRSKMVYQGGRQKPMYIYNKVSNGEA